MNAPGLLNMFDNDTAVCHWLALTYGTVHCLELRCSAAFYVNKDLTYIQFLHII